MKKATPYSSTHSWMQKEIARLGKVSDSKLALEIGIPTHAVFAKRRSMGIAALHPRTSLKWGRKELALLGKHPDAEVARLLKISRKSTIEKRLSLGIPSYAKSSNFWHTWTNREIALLGTRTDAEIAEKIGISPLCVSFKRYKLNIPALNARNAPNRPQRNLTDWTKQEIALLGTMTDLEIAGQLDLNHSTIRNERISLSIQPFRKWKRRHSIWSPEVVARLGKEPPRKIAEDIGVSRQRVDQKCIELGIKPFNANPSFATPGHLVDSVHGQS